MRRASAVVARAAVVTTALVASACSAGTEPPAESRVSVAFPSTRAAVAVDTLVLQVFDAPDEETCLDLVMRRRTAQSLPVPLVDEPPTPLCDFLAGRTTPIDLAYGRRAFLVVAQRGGKDWMIGCARSGVGNAADEVTVPLTLFSNQIAVPDTKCTQLSQHCANGC